MKKDYISIIIPCYNVEKYISKCIDSILNCNFKNYEIILVDDCSTDNTLEIITDYEKKYENIKVLKNDENRGAGYSRNFALKIAKYDLISFIDSDDYIESNYYDELLNVMKKENADVAVCDIFVKYDNVDDGVDQRSCACEGKVCISNLINNGLAASPCNKLFKKKLLMNNLFAEGIMNEDIPAVLGYLMDCKKGSYTEKTFYTYVQRKSSVQNENVSFKRFDIFKAVDILETRKNKNKNFLKCFDSIIYNQIIMFFVYVIPKENHFFKRYKLLKEFYHLSKKHKIRQNHYLWNFLAFQSLKSKIYYKLLFKLNDNGFSFFTNCLVSIYNLRHSRRKMSVIGTDISIDKLIELAKIQSLMRDGSKTLSVVIPNYNYEKFLLQRIYSILYQHVKINEIIILDDCSSDNSRELIDMVVDNLKDYINIRKIYNESNSGSAFKQWRKGFENAASDYVWIAEADDYCDRKFLSSVFKPIIKDDNVVISYSDTAFIDKDGYKILKTIKPEIDIMKTSHWNSNYINSGISEYTSYSYLNCTIANVSSVIFKKGNYTEFFELSGKYKQAGDWLFYVNIMRCGNIAFTNKPLNYYRVHGNNVTSTTKKQAHFNEIKKIHNYMRKKYGFSAIQEKNIQERYDFLKRVWKIEIGDDDDK